MPAQPPQRNDTTGPQDLEPILCRCWAWRHRLMGDHRDWVAELKRNRAAGRVPDDFYFAALAG